MFIFRKSYSNVYSYRPHSKIKHCLHVLNVCDFPRKNEKLLSVGVLIRVEGMKLLKIKISREGEVTVIWYIKVY